MKNSILLLLICISLQLSAQDFRKVNWGTSAEDIKSKETATFKESESGNDMLYYEATLSDRKVQVMYKLIDNKLVRTKYIFLEEHSNNNDFYADYLHFKNLLSKKYGNPDTYDQKWVNDNYKHDIGYIGTALASGHVVVVETWKKDKSEIAHAIYGKNKKITHVIEYVSNKYRYLEKKAKDDSAMDDL